MELTRQLDLEFILLRRKLRSIRLTSVLIFFTLLILGSTFYKVQFILLYSRKPFIHFSYVHYFGATSSNLLTNLKTNFYYQM